MSTDSSLDELAIKASIRPDCAPTQALMLAVLHLANQVEHVAAELHLMRVEAELRA